MLPYFFAMKLKWRSVWDFFNLWNFNGYMKRVIWGEEEEFKLSGFGIMYHRFQLNPRLFFSREKTSGLRKGVFKCSDNNLKWKWQEGDNSKWVLKLS